MIEKASEVAWECVSCNSGVTIHTPHPEVITADRMALVARLRELNATPTGAQPLVNLDRLLTCLEAEIEEAGKC